VIPIVIVVTFEFSYRESLFAKSLIDVPKM
jgi:hypothetical protein